MDELQSMLDLASSGIGQIMAEQRAALSKD
jgi:ribonuclease PH